MVQFGCYGKKAIYKGGSFVEVASLYYMQFFSSNVFLFVFSFPVNQNKTCHNIAHRQSVFKLNLCFFSDLGILHKKSKVF